MKNSKYIFILSLVLNVVMGTYCVKKVYYKYLKNETIDTVRKLPKDEKLTYFLKRNELFEKLQVQPNSIFFIGNSLTQNYEIKEFFSSANIYNRGINGDIVDGVYKRLGPIIKAKPSKIFLEIGINDLGHGTKKEVVLRNYTKIIRTLKKELPSCKVYINGIFPTGETSKDLPTYCGTVINHDIRTINSSLEQICEDNNYTFVDVHKYFSKGKYINAKYSVDGVHLSYEGYLLWTKILQPFISVK